MLNLKWRTCGDDGRWCSFDNLILEGPNKVDGVYIIWHAGNPSRVVRVGQGNIGKRIAAHRKDPDVTYYRSVGKLLVTWAAVPANQRDGVEAHLADEWNPLVGDRFPDTRLIAVNSPWS